MFRLEPHSPALQTVFLRMNLNDGAKRYNSKSARMAKLADARDLKSRVLNGT